MPELPEVETIATALRGGTLSERSSRWTTSTSTLRDGSGAQPALLGAQIRDAQVLWERTLAEPSIMEFRRRIYGQRIGDIQRRGKYLIFLLSQDALLIHLRMSGDLLLEGESDAIAPHHRLLLYFDNGLRMAFNDPRKFGRAWLVADPSSVLGPLGPEPLGEAFTAAELYRALRSRHRLLKPLLLDQTFLAGLGNIYTDEALNLARLHPLMLSDKITPEQAESLWSSIREVLQEGIRRSGASIDWVYRGGDFQNYFRVYQRTGEACPRCGTLIQRIVIGQRGTHFCPRCQVLP